MLVPTVLPIIGAVAANTAARSAMTAAMAANTATRAGGGHGMLSPLSSDAKAEGGGWQGVQCCPACLEPITDREKWSACCSKCGHTERLLILTKTRARRRVVNDDGEEVWEYKDGKSTGYSAVRAPLDSLVWVGGFIAAAMIFMGVLLLVR